MNPPKPEMSWTKALQDAFRDTALEHPIVAASVLSDVLKRAYNKRVAQKPEPTMTEKFIKRISQKSFEKMFTDMASALVLGHKGLSRIFIDFCYANDFLSPLAANVLEAALNRVFESIESTSNSRETTAIQRTAAVTGHAFGDDDLHKQLANLLSLITQGVAVFFGVSHAYFMPTLGGWISQIVKVVMQVSRSAVGLVHFFTMLVDFVVWVYDVCRRKRLKMSLLAQLESEEPAFMAKWVEEVQYLTRADIANKCVADETWAARVTFANGIADYLLRDISVNGVDKQRQTIIMRLASDIRGLRDKVLMRSLKFSTRPEPYCIWIFGQAGVGKSQMASDIVTEYLVALQDLGVSFAGNPSYVVQPGTKYWTGCEGKLAVIFDDFCTNASAENKASQIEVFQRLKSCATFIPEQADLPDKGHPFVPELVIVLANSPSPGQDPTLNESEAFGRRRNKLLHVTSEVGRVSDVWQQLKSTTAVRSRSERHQHLRFTEYDPVTNLKKDMAETAGKTYQDLIKHLIPEMLLYRAHQHQLYDEKISDLIGLQPTSNKNVTLQEMFDDVVSRSAKCFAIHPGIDRNLAKSNIQRVIESFYGVSPSATPLSDKTAPIVEQLGAMMAENPEVSEPDIAEGHAKWTELTNRTNEAFVSAWHNLTEFIASGFDQEPCMCEHVAVFPSAFITGTGSLEKNLQALVDEGWLTANTAHEHVDLPVLKYLDLYMEGYCPRFCVLRSLPYWIEKSQREGDPQAVSEARRALYTYWGKRPKLEWPEVGERVSKSIAATISSAIYEDEKCTKIKPVISLSLKVGFVALWTWFIVRRLRRSNQELREKVEGHVTYRSGETKTKAKPRTAKANLVKTIKPLFAQGNAGFTGIAPLFLKNTAFLTFYFKPTSVYAPPPVTVRILILCGHTALGLKHYFLGLKEHAVDKVCIFTARQKAKVEIDYDSLEIAECESSELVRIQLPISGIVKSSCLLRHIASQKSIEAIESMPRKATIFTLAPETLTQAWTNVDVHYSTNEFEVQTFTGLTSSKVDTTMTYPWGKAGDCMSLIVQDIPQPVITGVHIAGNRSMGVGERIVSDTFKAWGCCDHHETVVQPSLESQLTQQAAIVTGSMYEIFNPVVGRPFDLGDTPCKVEYELKLPSPLAVSPAAKSKILPSEIQGHEDYPEPQTFPAPLHRDDVEGRFSPMRAGVSFHGLPALGMPRRQLQMAAEQLEAHFLFNVHPLRQDVGPLSDFQSVRGVPGIQEYPPMDLTTSEGLPYVWGRPEGEKNKSWLIQYDDEKLTVSFHPTLTKIRDLKYHERTTGVIPFTPFTDCLKDARIKKDKLMTPGATRIFSSGPTDFVIDCRKYLGDFFAAFVRQRSKCFHSIGINIYGPEWTELAQRLQSNGKTKFLCGDYSKFGPTLMPDCIKAAFDVIIAWYRMQGADEDHIMIIQSIMWEIINSRHVCLDTLYTTLCGSPSGTPITAPLNSMVNIMYILTAWICLWLDSVPELATLQAFMQYCEVTTYGDDVVIGVDDAVVEQFNNEYLQRFFASRGLRYTDATKSGTIRKWCKFEDVDFLKCKFLRNPQVEGLYLPALSKTSIIDCANWIHKSMDNHEQTLLVIEASSLLAYGWGPKFHKEHLKLLAKVAASISPNRPLRAWTWSELYYNFSSGKFTFIVEDPADLASGASRALEAYSQRLKELEEM